MTPAIESILPSAAGAAGGELVRLVGTGFAPRVDVRFGDVRATVLSVLFEGGRAIVDVRTPQSSRPGPVSVVAQNLDASGAPIAGEAASVPFRFLRAQISQESDLTRLVRTLLRALKAQVLANTTTPISLDYREQTTDVIPIAKVPSFTVLGPDIRENRVYASNAVVDRIVQGPSGLEIERVRPPITVDLRFLLEAVTNSTAEHLELLVALVNFFHRNPYLLINRDPADPAAGVVRFEMASDGEVQSAVRLLDDVRKDDRRAFQWALVIRGFPVDEHVVTGRAHAASGVEVRTRRLAEEA
jgi:hypothetical protein